MANTSYPYLNSQPSDGPTSERYHLAAEYTKRKDKAFTLSSYKPLGEIYSAYAESKGYVSKKESLLSSPGNYFYYWKKGLMEILWNNEIVEMCTKEMGEL